MDTDMPKKLWVIRGNHEVDYEGFDSKPLVHPGDYTEYVPASELTEAREREGALRDKLLDVRDLLRELGIRGAAQRIDDFLERVRP